MSDLFGKNSQDLHDKAKKNNDRAILDEDSLIHSNEFNIIKIYKDSNIKRKDDLDELNNIENDIKNNLSQ